MNPELHYNFPERAKGELANNPDVFDMWLSGKTIAPSAWPYIMLYYDKKMTHNEPSYIPAKISFIV